MRVNYLLDACPPIVDHVVGRCEITSLKSVLSSAVTREEVMLNTALAINHCLVVVFKLGLREDHFASLVRIVVHGR